MTTTYNPKSRIVIMLDEPSDDPFDSTKRRSLGAFSANIISCDWKYKPSNGGMIDAKVKMRVKRGTDLRERFDTSQVGLATIYRGNHLTELPILSGYVDSDADFTTNERSYLLFQGMVENPESDSTSDIVSFKIRGFGKSIGDIEYTGTFTNESIGDIFTTVMTEVIARDNQPIKSFVTEDMTITANVPDSRHVLHRIMLGEREYKNASVKKILKDLQEAAGGKGSVTFGVRCGATSDSFGEAYLLEWRGKQWTPSFQIDEDDLDEVAHVPKSRLTDYELKVDTSNIKNSVTVYGAELDNGQDNYVASSEVLVSVKEHGRRHAVVVNTDLTSESACLEYAAAWLQENSARELSVDFNWSDLQTLKDSRRIGAGTSAVPRDMVHYLRDMNSIVHVLDSTNDHSLYYGDESQNVGINAMPMAVNLQEVNVGAPPLLKIDTTKAPWSGSAEHWTGAAIFGHPHPDVVYANNFSVNRSMLWTVGYGFPSTANMHGKVLVEWSKTMRLRFSQSGGAGANYGIGIETWRSGSGWVNEQASTEEGAAHGVFEVIPATHGESAGGAKIYFELSGKTSTYPIAKLWSNYVYPWRTLLASANASQVLFGTATGHIQYAHLTGQTADFIALGCGTTSDGTTFISASSGDLEIYGMRCDDGLFNTVSASYSEFEYGGRNAEGITDTTTGAYDSEKSFIGKACLKFTPQIEDESSLIMFFEPSIMKVIDGNERYHVRWSRALLNVVEEYDGHSLDGFHAELTDANSGDGLTVGDDVASSTDAEILTGVRSRPWRLGATGAYRKQLGDGVAVLPYQVNFKYNGEHSPLSIKVSGGTPADSIVGSTDELLERIEASETTTTKSL